MDDTVAAHKVRWSAPVVPAPLGALGDSIAFLRDPAAFTMGRGRALGDFYRVRVPGRHLHVVTHPDVIEQILNSKGDAFEKSRLYWGELKRIIGEAMASLEGDRWRYLRKLEQPFFTPRASEARMVDASDITRLEFDDLTSEIGDGADLPMLDVVSRLNTRLILAILFGMRAEEKRLEITRRIVDGEATIAWRSKFPWRFATGWLNGKNARAMSHKAFFQAYADHVEASDAASDPEILLGALASLRADGSRPRYTHPLLRNEMIVHLGASTETQGVAEGWCLYLLWKHPEILARLRAEIGEVAGPELVDSTHVSDLAYTLQVVRETLRLFPTAYGVVRDCVEPTDLSGQPVHPGQVFFISLVGLHRSPRFWDDPDVFKPERFAPGRAETYGRYRYMPFGGGRHICIGQHMALPMMVMGIAQFAQRFDWHFANPSVRPTGLATLKPRCRFIAHIRPRRRR